MKAHIMTKNETSEFLLAKTISSLEYITSNFSGILFLKNQPVTYFNSGRQVSTALSEISWVYYLLRQ